MFLSELDAADAVREPIKPCGEIVSHGDFLDSLTANSEVMPNACSSRGIRFIKNTKENFIFIRYFNL